MTSPPRGPRILIVEDDPDQRSLLSETLEMHYGPTAPPDIVAVGTAAECLAEELAGFDVVLLDYHLPDMEGIKVLDSILAVADVPVVFVTGENDSALAAEAIKRGAQDYVVKLGEFLFAIPVVIGKSINLHRIKKENERLRRQLEAMLDELTVKNAQLEQSLAKLQTMAATDHLTGLSNRRRFGEELERQFSDAMRYGGDLTCCMCDLDHFKQLNDTLGHQFGDKVLVATAEVILSVLRASDIAARYGGDEFVLLLPHTSRREALAMAKRLREQLASRMRQLCGPTSTLTLSMGIASLHEDRPTSADLLVSLADRALYAAKAAGKDRVALFGDVGDPAASGA